MADDEQQQLIEEKRELWPVVEELSSQPGRLVMIFDVPPLMYSLTPEHAERLAHDLLRKAEQARGRPVGTA